MRSALSEQSITLCHEGLLTRLEARTIVAEYMIRTDLPRHFQGLDPIALGEEEVEKTMILKDSVTEGEELSPLGVQCQLHCTPLSRNERANACWQLKKM